MNVAGVELSHDIELEEIPGHAHLLAWDAEAGIGFLPIGEGGEAYAGDYWEKYQGYLDTPMEARLNRARLSLVNAWMAHGTTLVDVGIGNGSFLSAAVRHATPYVYGYDVNPHAERWLKERQRWVDVRVLDWDALSMWDVLEHIEDPTPYLARARSWVFVSAPIYDDLDDILGSKHLRPGEHCWYWTRTGLARFMASFGFDCVAENRAETLAGRESIGSFVFRRVTPIPAPRRPQRD